MAETIWERNLGVLLKKRRMLVLKVSLGYFMAWSNISPHLSQLAQKAGLKKGIYQAGGATAAAQMGHSQSWFSHQPKPII